MLASGSGDNTVKLWHTETGRLFQTIEGHVERVRALAFSPDGAQLAAASYDDDTVRLWDTSPAAARAAICANLGQPITPAQWAGYAPGVPYRAPCS